MLTTHKTSTYKTSIDIPAERREPLIEMLNHYLAGITDLKLQTKQAHWNVKGMNFIALHEMFDKFADMLDGYVDMVAERVTTLGGTAMGTTRIAAANSPLPEYDLGAVEGREHVTALVERYSQLANLTRANIDKSTNLSDADTADLFTEISRELDKSLWFLEAHLQA